MAPAAKNKKGGKENAPPAKSKPVEMDADESFGDISMASDSVPAKPLKPVAKSTGKNARTAKRADDEDEDVEEAESAAPEASGSDLTRKLAAMTAERDRLRKQRDEVSKQFEDLTRIRNTETEKLFGRYKESAETAAKAQSDIIANLTALTDKQSERITGLEKSLAAADKRTDTPAPPTETASAPPSASSLSKSEQKELKALREEVAKLRSGSKEKDAKITQLEQEYKAEVAHSQSLQQSTRTNPASLAASTSHQSEESEKDSISLAFYEDMTELQIVNVKIKRDPKNGKEATLNCLHTNQENKRTLQFKLRSYQEISQDLIAAKADNPWVRMVDYQPESLAAETDKEFVKQLDVFATGFTIERKQLSGMWDQLRAKVSGNGEDEEDDE